MKLNHINLVLPDVAAAVAFFESHFEFTRTQIKGDHAIAILEGSDGFSLALMSGATSSNNEAVYPDAFHIGFMLGGKDAVADVWQKLKDGGIDAGRPPGKIRDTFGFYFSFQNILIEVGCINA